MRYFATLLGAGLVIVALASGCTGKDGAEDATGTTSNGVQQRTVALSELKFEPATLTVRAGPPVRLTVKNAGTAEHDLVIAGLPATGVKNAADAHRASMQPGMIMADTKPKSQAEIAFTPMKAGTYEIYCSYPGHKDGGMKGTLIVE